ncbi:MAG: hypothetical protein N3H30_01785 [Candidatus Micrarchaeota archaeon]|nr:hypothetical protein [Candidatus Micrarchaeota archaeon]
MRKLLIFMLFAALAWSFDIGGYIAPNESIQNVTFIDMAGPDGAYVMYYMSGEPMLMVKDGQVVTDKEIVRAVLERYYFTKDFPKRAEIEEIRNVTLAFNASREHLYNDEKIKEFFPPEAYCKQITGLKFRPCNYSQDEVHPCLMTCASVPLCKNSIEGLGDSIGFLNGIMAFDKDTRKLDSDVNAILTITKKFDGLSYDDYGPDDARDLESLIGSMGRIEGTVKDIYANFLFKDLLKSEGLQSYCSPLNYSMADAKTLATLSAKYGARTSKLLNIEREVDALLNETARREGLHAMLDKQSKFGAKYAELEARYNTMYTKYVKASTIIDDAALAENMQLLRQKKEAARDDIYSGDFEKSDLTIKQFHILADNFEDELDGYFNKTTRLQEAIALAEKKIIVAEWDLGVGDLLDAQHLNDIKVRKADLDKRIAEKFKSAEEVDEMSVKYEALVDEIDQIIASRGERSLDNVLSEAVVLTNAYSDTLASAYASVSGADAEGRRQVREYVLPLTLLSADLLLIGGFIAGFVYLVAYGKIRLHKIAALLWSFLFIAFFTAISAGSIATYLMISEKANKAGFDIFYAELLKADKVAVVLDTRGGAVPDSCALEIERVLKEEMNKSVSLIKYRNDGCQVLRGPASELGGTISTDSCDVLIEGQPSIITAHSEQDYTGFSMKYSVAALVTGSDDYIKQCKLAVILSEEV